MELENIYDNIARVSLNHFQSLPRTGKPRTNEWTVLSTIVEETKSGSKSELTVVALGTGSKCIGASKMCPNGTILNDSHAEVICRKAFIRYLYNEMNNDATEVLTFNTNTNKFAVRDNLRYHFFTTHVPCGDAAIFPKQDTKEYGDCISSITNNEISAKRSHPGIVNKEELPPKRIKHDSITNDTFRTGAKCLPTDSNDSCQPGINYHTTGVVRTKPGRGDRTLSVSCSDKIAKWCHLGIQGALLSIVLDKPIFLDSCVIAGNTPFSEDAATRAIYDRLKQIDSLCPPKMVICQVETEFEFAKCADKRPASASIIYSRNCKLEVSVDGRRQGVTKKNKFSKGSALSISKYSLYTIFLCMVSKFNITISNYSSLEKVSYTDVKDCAFSYNLNRKLLLTKGFNAWTVKDRNMLLFTK